MQAHVLRETDDIFYLSFDELERVDQQIIGRRRDEFWRYQALTTPKVGPAGYVELLD